MVLLWFCYGLALVVALVAGAAWIAGVRLDCRDCCFSWLGFDFDFDLGFALGWGAALGGFGGAANKYLFLSFSKRLWNRPKAKKY